MNGLDHALARRPPAVACFVGCVAAALSCGGERRARPQQDGESATAPANSKRRGGRADATEAPEPAVAEQLARWPESANAVFLLRPSRAPRALGLVLDRFVGRTPALVPSEWVRSATQALACLPQPHTWGEAAAAFDFGSKRFAIEISGSELDSRLVLRCLARRLRIQAPLEDELDGMPRLRVGEVWAVALTPDRVLLTGAEWGPVVLARRGGDGRSASEGVLGEVRPITPPGSLGWVHAEIPAAWQAKAPVNGLARATMRLDHSGAGDAEQLEGTLEVACESSDRASRLESVAQLRLHEWAPLLLQLGAPPELIEERVLTREGDRVTLRLRLDVTRAERFVRDVLRISVPHPDEDGDQDGGPTDPEVPARIPRPASTTAEQAATSGSEALAPISSPPTGQDASDG